MTRAKIYCITILILIASVPWFFFEGGAEHFLGLPAWALYSLAVTILYAVAVAFVLQRFWPLLAGATEDEADV